MPSVTCPHPAPVRKASCLLALVALVAPEIRVAGDPLVRLTSPRFSYPTWSPDMQHVLYESSASGSWEIYVMDLDGLTHEGGGVRRLTDNDVLDRMPSWSPDGKQIAFVSDRDGDLEVFRMRADGSDQTQLTRNGLAEIHPYWSPDGERIIFNRRVAERPVYGIYIMDRDGGNETEILADDELNSYAQISPDGDLIVFDKWQDNDEQNGEIYVMSVDGTGLRRLTDNEDVYDGYPTWFPDAKSVLYSSEVDGAFKLFSLPIDGSERRQLTFGPGDDQRADVSPDGARVVFNRTIDDNVNIYVLDLVDPG